MHIKPRPIGAVVGALLALGVGSQLAGAQESLETTTPPAAETAPEETPPAPAEEKNCDKDGDGHPDGGTSSTPEVAETSV